MSIRRCCVAKMRPFALQLLQTFLEGHSQFFDLSEKGALMDTQILCRSTPAEIMTGEGIIDAFDLCRLYRVIVTVVIRAGIL